MEDNASKIGQFFKNFETLKSLTSSQTKKSPRSSSEHGPNVFRLLGSCFFNGF